MTDTSANDTAHPAPHRGRAPGGQLAIALFLAPLAFTLQIMASYVLAARVCSHQGNPQPWLIALHAVAIVAAAVGFVVALTLWRRTRGEKSGDAREATDRGEGRTRFLALCGLYAAALFLVAVLVDASAVLLLGPCPGLPPLD